MAKVKALLLALFWTAVCAIIWLPLGIVAGLFAFAYVAHRWQEVDKCGWEDYLDQLTREFEEKQERARERLKNNPYNY